MDDRPSWAHGWAGPTLGWLRERVGASKERLADAERLLGFLRGSLEFDPRDDDVFVATYPRSGTTWMQFLVYLLSSDRSLSFRHLSEVVPWFERSLALGTRHAQDFAGLSSPRMFKTHLRPEWLPSRGRVIYVERRVEDVLDSYHRFYRSHLGYRGTFEAFFERFIEGRLQYRSWFDHVQTWRRAADHRAVLWIRYEDMEADLREVVLQVARFLDRGCAPDQLTEVLRMSSRAFMKEHESLFDPITEHLIDQRMVQGRFISTQPEAPTLTSTQAHILERMRAEPRSIRRAEHRLFDFLH